MESRIVFKNSYKPPHCEIICSELSAREYFFTQLSGSEGDAFNKLFKNLGYIHIDKYIVIQKDGIVKFLNDNFETVYEFDNNEKETEIHDITFINDYIFVTRGHLYYHTIVYDKNMNVYYDFGKNRYVEYIYNQTICIVSNIKLTLFEPYKDRVIKSELMSSRYFDLKNKMFIDDDENAKKFCKFEYAVEAIRHEGMVYFREFYEKPIVPTQTQS